MPEGSAPESQVSALQQQLDEAWEKLASCTRITKPVIIKVIRAELAGASTFRLPDEPTSPGEQLLTTALRLNSQEGQEAAHDFFGKRLQLALELANVSQAAGEPTDATALRQAQTCNAAIGFISSLTKRRR